VNHQCSLPPCKSRCVKQNKEKKKSIVMLGRRPPARIKRKGCCPGHIPPSSGPHRWTGPPGTREKCRKGNIRTERKQNDPSFVDGTSRAFGGLCRKKRKGPGYRYKNSQCPTREVTTSANFTKGSVRTKAYLGGAASLGKAGENKGPLVKNFSTLRKNSSLRQNVTLPDAHVSNLGALIFEYSRSCGIHQNESSSRLKGS